MKYPGVAVSVIVVNDPILDPEVAKLSNSNLAYEREMNVKILLGKRKGPLGTGCYSLPGGKVDMGEAPIDAARREVEEETGVRLKNVEFTDIVSNDWFPEQGKHFVNLFYVGEARNPKDLHVPETEKEKFDEWLWFDPRNLPNNTWMHTASVIEAVFDTWLKIMLRMPGIGE